MKIVRNPIGQNRPKVLADAEVNTLALFYTKQPAPDVVGFGFEVIDESSGYRYRVQFDAKELDDWYVRAKQAASDPAGVAHCRGCTGGKGRVPLGGG